MIVYRLTKKQQHNKQTRIGFTAASSRVQQEHQVAQLVERESSTCVSLSLTALPPLSVSLLVHCHSTDL